MDIFPDWLGQYGSNVVGIAGYRTVTGPIKNTQGGNLASGILRVKLRDPVIEGTMFIVPQELDAEIENGIVAINLAAPGHYEFLVLNQDHDALWDFQSYLSDDTDAPISLAELYISQTDVEQDLTTIPRTFVGLLDTPNSLLGAGGKLLQIGEDEAGVQVTSKILWGTGSPQGVIVATIGTIYIREDGGAGTTMYVKESGNGTANGWVAK